jgi:hypothetical protein
MSITSKVRVSILALSRSPKDIGSDIFPTGLIGFPPKPCMDILAVQHVLAQVHFLEGFQE